MSRFYFKIILPSILSILLFILTIFLIIIPRFEQSIMNGKREMIKELTNSAWSILSKYESDETSGLLSRKEAQETAVSRIQYLRYGEENKDYFWITDMTPVMIMHPYRPDLNGRDLTDFKDPHGKKMFVEFVNTVKESDHGYVDYMWQWKDDSLHIVPKLSYVKVFKPWGWVIGTGVYIEDVKKETEALTNRLLLISTGISILIAFLLLFISQQSLSIEQKRITAENELHEQKEKYRTLVEASTEGIIMQIEGRISYINNVIVKMSGYDSSELINLSLKELVSEKNNKNIIDTFSKKTVKDGQYDLFLKRKSGGVTEALATSSNSVLFGKAVNIIIVKDITLDRNANLSSLDYQKLIAALSTGFFRIRLDHKGRFILANETTLKILGYDNFSELSDEHIVEMLANHGDRKNLKRILLENGIIKNRVIKIRRKNGETAAVSVTLVISESENDEGPVCDGIIEDVTIREIEKREQEDLITELKSNSLLIEQPVKGFLSGLNTLDCESTISEAVNELEKHKTDCLLISKNEKDYIGILTNSDIQNRVLTLGLNPDNPVYLIMSSPVVYINENTSIIDALNICGEKEISHAAARNEAGEITGVLRINDVYRKMKDSLAFYLSGISKAETKDGFRQNYRNFQQFIKPLINSGISVQNITSVTSSFSDAAVKRAIELAVRETGEPPADFSFICMGSEGRKEETLLTDQDNAVIYDDTASGKNYQVNDYFNKLGEKVCSLLDYTGYAFCRGNIMAKNPKWCQPLSVWEKYFAGWISSPEPQNLLEATIFFDFRNVYGTDKLTDRLRDTIGILIKEHSMFLYHLAYNTGSVKPEQISSGNIIPDKNPELIDLKNAVNPLIMFARAYSLKNNIRLTGTVERINALKGEQILSPETADEIIYAYNFLTGLRFRNQTRLLESNLPLSNILNTKDLIDIEASILKKVLSLIPVYQNKIRVDFRITT